MSIAVNNKLSSTYKAPIFYLILLCITVGSGWFVTRYLGDKVRQEILEFNESMILTHSSHFTREFEHIEKAVRVLSGSPLIAPALISRKDEDIANANSTLDRYNSGLDSSVSYLMDSNGITIASSNRNDPDSFVGKSYQFRPYFMQASKGAPGRYFALGVTSSKRGFYASYPVRDSKGQIIGVVVIKKDIDEKEADLSRYPYLFLVDPNGIIFLSSSKEMTFKSLWPISRKTRLALLESGQFGKREFEAVLPREVVDGMEIRIDGKDYLASRKVINPEGWSTVIMTSTGRILQYKLAGLVISMWICTLIVVPMIINYRTSRSAKMVRVSETRYRELFDNISSGVAIYEVKDGGKDFILKDFNKAGERIEGVRKEDIIGKSIYEVRPGIKQFGLLDVFERVLKTGIPEYHPASFYHDQKIAAWFENFVYKLPTGEMVDVYDDITDRMRAEEALRESQQMLQSVMDTIPVRVFWKDLALNYLGCNRPFALDAGLQSPEEIIGRNDFEMGWAEQAELYRSDDRLVMETRIAKLGYEEPQTTPRGDRIWLRTSKVPLFDVKGEIKGVLGTYEDITVHKQAEDALRESEELYRTLVSLSPDAISVADLNGSLTFTSPKAMEMFGDSPDDEILGRSILSWIAPEEHEKVFRNIQFLATEETPTGTEYTMIKKDGTRFIGEVNAAVIHSADGSPMSMIIITRDVTERKRAQDELFNSRQMLRSVLDNIPQRVFWKDRNSIYVGCNKPLALDCGYEDPSELVGKTDYDTASAPTADLYRADDREVMESGKSKINYEEPQIRSDGSQAWLITSKVPMYDQDGQVIGVLGTYADITERKLAEDALRQSEERFSRFFRSTPVGTSITRLSDGQIVDANDAFLGLYGYTREEVIGQTRLTLQMWANPEDQAKIVEVLQKQGRMQDFETKFCRKSGEIRDALVSAEVIEVAGQQYILGLTHDITESKHGEEKRKKLEEQLFQAQKMESVGRLAGGVAHDFNNMLGVIIGRAELALNTEVSADQLQHNLQEIHKASLRSADLTRQLLAFARKQTAVPKVLDLNGTISGMLNMLRRLIGEDIDLSWQPGLDLWKLKIDPSQVDQILANLAVNARDAISGVGAINIKTENVVMDDSCRAETPEFIPGQYVLLTVSDTGAGMSKEVRENLFEPFFTTKEVGKGTGLGLSTVYGIVKQNDGFIYVASEPGKGATFKIYLPRFEVATTQVPSEEITGKRPTGTETILLVEDDEAILNLGKVILENMGYTVLGAQTPLEALHLAEEHPGDIQLLITDVVMPEMNGRELAEQVGAIRPNLKCLYMSGYTADVIAHRGILDEGLNFIQKPFLSDDLAARVRQVLDHLG